MKAAALIILALALIPVASAQEQVCVYYFYSDFCTYCKAVDPLLNDLDLKYDWLDLHKLNVFDKENKALLVKLAKQNHVSAGYPVIFYADKYLSGKSAILKNLDAELLKYKDAGLQCPTVKKKSNVMNWITSLWITLMANKILL